MLNPCSPCQGRKKERVRWSVDVPEHLVAPPRWFRLFVLVGLMTGRGIEDSFGQRKLQSILSLGNDGAVTTELRNIVMIIVEGGRGEAQPSPAQPSRASTGSAGTYSTVTVTVRE